jgi:hypothetical protein
VSFTALNAAFLKDFILHINPSGSPAQGKAIIGKRMPRREENYQIMGIVFLVNNKQRRCGNYPFMESLFAMIC